VTGFSFKTESFRARRRISGSNNGRARTSFFGIRLDSSTGAGAFGAIAGGGGKVVGEAMTQLQTGTDRNIVENNLPSCIRKCSTIGPSADAGKNVRATK